VVTVEPGDLIRWKDQIWLVRKVERELATAIVESASRVTEVLPSDADLTGMCEAWCRPAREWPSAALPFRATRLVGVRRAQTDLLRFQHWVKLDDFQIGGVLYLNPELNLSFGDRLTVVYRGRGKETTLPVEIPRKFNPLPQKHASEPVFPKALEPEPAATLFALLKDE
jgi:hypothetical protein